ncbi:MAG: hypothetical protein HYW69_03055 [Candidatus Nealsonbacteria bacterium]|nr:hypothetical protein [Candidatus Nealsonbacteria bacterium]
MADEFDKKGIMKAMAVALTISVLGIVVLGWQYRRLEKQQLPALEEKIEQNSAQDVLERFLATRADILLTERAMEQKLQGDFWPEDNLHNYEIVKVEKPANDSYKFVIKAGDLVEIITLTKILGKYYIDSIEMAG